MTEQLLKVALNTNQSNKQFFCLDILVYVKKCERCGMTYRYQEWRDGIHNFNNTLFLGIDACYLIRAGLKVKVYIISRERERERERESNISIKPDNNQKRND